MASALFAVALEVVEERLRQLDRWDADHDDRHTEAEWAWLLLRRVTDLCCPQTEFVDPRRQLIEVAAIAAAAVEALDRRAANGLPG